MNRQTTQAIEADTLAEIAALQADGWVEPDGDGWKVSEEGKRAMAESLAQDENVTAYSILSNLLNHHEKAVRASMKSADLPIMSAVEFQTLTALYARDGQKASELAAAAGRAATSFTPILDNLESAGLIERRPHPTDRRAVLIHLTDTAEAMRSAFAPIAHELNVNLWAMLTGVL